MGWSAHWREAEPAGNANGTGAAASFQQMMGLTLDTLGNIYVAESGGAKIRRITPGGVVSTFAGTGSFGSSDNAVATAATFGFPSSGLL